MFACVVGAAAKRPLRAPPALPLTFLAALRAPCGACVRSEEGRSSSHRASRRNTLPYVELTTGATGVSSRRGTLRSGGGGSGSNSNGVTSLDNSGNGVVVPPELQVPRSRAATLKMAEDYNIKTGTVSVASF